MIHFARTGERKEGKKASFCCIPLTAFLFSYIKSVTLEVASAVCQNEVGLKPQSFMIWLKKKKKF